jgi:hypothetical protein
MSRTTNANSVAEAILTALISPNVCDSNFEPANPVDVLDGIRGAIKAHALAVESVGDRISDGLNKMAQAIDGLARAIQKEGPM